MLDFEHVYLFQLHNTSPGDRGPRDLVRAHMVDELPRLKRVLAKLARFDGAYLRFAGPMTVTVYRAGERVEEYADDAIWELMYFGHSRAAATPGMGG